MAKTRKSRREAARERMYHDLVFESAEHVFAEKGFDDATMQEIASEAEISLKTLYATFPGKAELYLEIQSVRGRKFLEYNQQAAAGAQSAIERLTLGVRAYVDFLLEHEDFLRIHLREGKAWGLGPPYADAEGWQAGVEHFAATLRQGMQEGIFHEGNAELMAMSGIAVMQVHLARIAARPAGADAISLAEEILVQLRRMYFRNGNVASPTSASSAS